MRIFLAIFLSAGIVSTIAYAGLALGYRKKIAGDAQITFWEFTQMYKTAPDKWEYNEYWNTVDYYPKGRSDYRSKVVRMSSYFDNIQLYLWGRSKKKERLKKKTDKETKELFASFFKDAIKTKDKPDEEEELTNLDYHNQLVYNELCKNYPDLNYEHTDT